ncbi:MAG: hypothetical protein ABIK61_04080 [candidate division WOR-3 bacterium]
MDFKSYLQKFYEQVEQISHIDVFINFTKSLTKPDGSKLWESLIPPTEIPPLNPEQMILAKCLAMKIPALARDDFNEGIKASWQKFWLKCCLNEKCDYGFTMLRNIKPPIDREKEILELARRDRIIWKYVDIDNLNVRKTPGRKLYFEICLKFLLKRSSFGKALRLVGWDKKTFFCLLLHQAFRKLKDNYFFPDLILNFIPIRIIFGLLITNYFAISVRWLWALISKAIENNLIYTLTMFIFAVLSWLYLSFVECFPEIERNAKEAIKRGGIVLILNYLLSLFIAWVLVYFVVLSSAREFITPGYGCKPIILYSQIVVFISLFIQHFWQEKTITEPY